MRTLRIYTFLSGLVLLLGAAVLLKHLASRQYANSRPSVVTSNVSSSPRLHLIIPATRANAYLCQLLISAATLDYPAPVLINWQDDEDADEYVQHLAKIEGIRGHLAALPKSDDDDLLLILDGYDAWFQLGPQALIDRYFTVVEALNQQNEASFGRDFVRDHNIQDTVIFGPDKLCWPVDADRAACWAVPDSPLPRHAFGPDTDHGITEHNRPRWLNSGSIMGSVSKIRDVFERTAVVMAQHPDQRSDQFHFANVFADQSYQRLVEKMFRDDQAGIDVTEERNRLMPGRSTKDESQHGSKEIPVQSSIAASNFRIGLDYESTLFQTVAFYDDYITWIRYNRSLHESSSDSQAPWGEFTFPADLKLSSPLDAYAPFQLNDNQPQSVAEASLQPSLNWENLPLAMNTITKQISALIHFTGKKGYRDIWWNRNWFYPFAKEILNHRRKQHKEYIKQDSASDLMPSILGAQRAANVEKKGEQILWAELCGPYEQTLFAH